MTDTNLAPGTANEPAGSTTPSPEVVPPAASEPAAASTEPAAPAEAPIANGDSTDSPPGSDAPPADGRKPKADRIKELIAERNFWRERAVASPPPKAEPQPPAEPEAPPTLEQHGYDTEKWAQAFSQYHERRSAQVVEQHLAKVDERRQASTVAEQFVQRETDFSTATPDYAEVVSDPTLQQYVTPTISDAIVTSPLGPQMSYHLATHREELAAIARMRPTQQAIALGELQATLKARSAAPKPAPTPKPVQQTRAPAPPSPVGGGSAPSKRPEDMTIGEYMEHRQRWARQ